MFQISDYTPADHPGEFRFRQFHLWENLVITQECIESVLPVVADSWSQLRRCDVYRLMSQIHYESYQSLTDAGHIITHKRSDLADEVRGCVAEIKDELGL